jgi:hypothetical protein
MKKESPTNDYLVGAKIDVDGNIDTSRALNMSIDSNSLAEAEKKRNLQNVRNIQEAFGSMTKTLDQEDQHLSLLLQEQGPLITNYLKKDSRGGQGGDIYKQMAPGIAMLGYQMTNSGFGRHEINTGDKKDEEENEVKAKKLYQAAADVFNQLMQKMYPEGISHDDALLAQLDGSLEEANGGIFMQVKNALAELYEKGLPHDNKGISEYQNIIDSLIQLVGNHLGNSVDIQAKLDMDGKGTPEKRENHQADLLTLAMVLKNLHNLRQKLVQHKYGTNAYDNFSPIDLKKIEKLENKINGS